MKKLFLSIVVFSFLLVVGCQENSITSPVLPNSVQKFQDPQGAITRGTIRLDGILRVPGELNSYYSISGNITYTDQLIEVPNVPPLPQTNVEVTLSVDANLADTAPPHETWNISATSKDELHNMVNGEKMLEKSFSIEGRNDGLVLVCRFHVTANSVELDSRWLSFSSNRINKTGSGNGYHTLPPVTNPDNSTN